MAAVTDEEPIDEGDGEEGVTATDEEPIDEGDKVDEGDEGNGASSSEEAGDESDEEAGDEEE